MNFEELFEKAKMLPNSVETVSCSFTMPDGSERTFQFTGYVIYSLNNKTNNKKYIGATHSPRTRILNHLYKLKEGKHYITDLQEEIDCDFDFEILEEGLTYRQAMEAEKQKMILFATWNRKCGYNYRDKYFECRNSPTALKRRLQEGVK